MRGSAHITTDHQRIQEWVEDRGGHPAVVTRTRGARGPGILRIDFPGFSGEGTLEPIEWNEFFKAFDQAELAFLYQEETGTGRPSRFNKFVHRDTMSFEDGGAPRSRARTVRGAASASKKRRTSKASTGRTTARAQAPALVWSVPSLSKKRATKVGASAVRGMGSERSQKKARAQSTRRKARATSTTTTRARVRRSA